MRLLLSQAVAKIFSERVKIKFDVFLFSKVELFNLNCVICTLPAGIS